MAKQKSTIKDPVRFMLFIMNVHFTILGRNVCQIIYVSLVMALLKKFFKNLKVYLELLLPIIQKIMVALKTQIC